MNCCCPLCDSLVAARALQVSSRSYYHCSNCDLVFLAAAERLSRAAEHAYYETHENDVNDLRYRKFLAQLADPLVQRLRAGAQGLDYGAGPGPALAAMFSEAGFPMEIFDPKFAPDTAILQRQYDFITCTEVVEHMHAPGREFERLETLLKPGGWLGVMTELRPSIEEFPGWHYHRDPTHVCFYSTQTIHWLTRRHSWTLDYLDARVVLWRVKPKRES